MKTLEAIQFLLDNPDEMIKEIGAEEGTTSYAKNDDGAIVSCSKNGDRYCLFSLGRTKLNARWQVVKKPPKQVSWQEAIQNWIDGEGFLIEYPNGTRIIFPGNKANLVDYANIAISKSIFRDCKFYI